MQMLDIGLIPTKVDLKQVMYSHMVIPQYLGGLQSRLLQQLLRIMLNYWHYMQLAGNACG